MISPSSPSLVDSYTAVMALIDVLVSDFVASDETARGRIARVERARSALAAHADGRS